MSAAEPDVLPPAEFSLELAPEPRFVSTARMFAASIARHYGCTEDLVQDVKVAISEACSHSVKAHTEADTDDPIELRIGFEGGKLRYQIVDAGTGVPELPRDLTTLVANDPAELLEGGVGLVLIHALFPDAEVGANEPAGTYVRFSLAVNGTSPTSAS